MLLGHGRYTTERYLGTKQDLPHSQKDAVKQKMVV